VHLTREPLVYQEIKMTTRSLTSRHSREALPMKVRLKIWRQADSADPGRFETYATPELSPNMSFLEMLDVVNEDLTLRGAEPVAFDHDCREGICGTCARW
jgi:succinate dehydrogenase / fumarate reductase, iron-sulfur subunit